MVPVKPTITSCEQHPSATPFDKEPKDLKKKVNDLHEDGFGVCKYEPLRRDWAPTHGFYSYESAEEDLERRSSTVSGGPSKGSKEGGSTPMRIGDPRRNRGKKKNEWGWMPLVGGGLAGLGIIGVIVYYVRRAIKKRNRMLQPTAPVPTAPAATPPPAGPLPSQPYRVPGPKSPRPGAADPAAPESDKPISDPDVQPPQRVVTTIGEGTKLTLHIIDVYRLLCEEPALKEKGWSAESKIALAEQIVADVYRRGMLEVLKNDMVTGVEVDTVVKNHFEHRNFGVPQGDYTLKKYAPEEHTRISTLYNEIDAMVNEMPESKMLEGEQRTLKLIETVIKWESVGESGVPSAEWVKKAVFNGHAEAAAQPAAQPPSTPPATKPDVKKIRTRWGEVHPETLSRIVRVGISRQVYTALTTFFPGDSELKDAVAKEVAVRLETIVTENIDNLLAIDLAETANDVLAERGRERVFTQHITVSTDVIESEFKAARKSTDVPAPPPGIFTPEKSAGEAKPSAHTTDLPKPARVILGLPPQQPAAKPAQDPGASVLPIITPDRAAETTRVGPKPAVAAAEPAPGGFQVPAPKKTSSRPPAAKPAAPAYIPPTPPKAPSSPPAAGQPAPGQGDAMRGAFGMIGAAQPAFVSDSATTLVDGTSPTNPGDAAETFISDAAKTLGMETERGTVSIQSDGAQDTQFADSAVGAKPYAEFQKIVYSIHVMKALKSDPAFAPLPAAIRCAIALQVGDVADNEISNERTPAMNVILKRAYDSFGIADKPTTTLNVPFTTESHEKLLSDSYAGTMRRMQGMDRFKSAGMVEKQRAALKFVMLWEARPRAGRKLPGQVKPEAIPTTEWMEKMMDQEKSERKAAAAVLSRRSPPPPKPKAIPAPRPAAGRPPTPVPPKPESKPPVPPKPESKPPAAVDIGDEDRETTVPPEPKPKAAKGATDSPTISDAAEDRKTTVPPEKAADSLPRFPIGNENDVNGAGDVNDQVPKISEEVVRFINEADALYYEMFDKTPSEVFAGKEARYAKAAIDIVALVEGERKKGNQKPDVDAIGKELLRKRSLEFGRGVNFNSVSASNYATEGVKGLHYALASKMSRMSEFRLLTPEALTRKAAVGFIVQNYADLRVSDKEASPENNSWIPKEDWLREKLADNVPALPQRPLDLAAAISSQPPPTKVEGVGARGASTKVEVKRPAVDVSDTEPTVPRATLEELREADRAASTRAEGVPESQRPTIARVATSDDKTIPEISLDELEVDDEKRPTTAPEERKEGAATKVEVPQARSTLPSEGGSGNTVMQPPESSAMRPAAKSVHPVAQPRAVIPPAPLVVPKALSGWQRFVESALRLIPGGSEVLARAQQQDNIPDDAPIRTLEEMQKSQRSFAMPNDADMIEALRAEGMTPEMARHLWETEGRKLVEVDFGNKWHAEWQRAVLANKTGKGLAQYFAERYVDEPNAVKVETMRQQGHVRERRDRKAETRRAGRSGRSTSPVK